MPYQGEIANKASHSDIVRNPDVAAFLKGCTYLREPSAEEAQTISARFQVIPPTDGTELPNYVIAVDGSFYEASITERLPSTRIGFIKIGAVLIDMAQYKSLRVGPFVDPFRVAELQRNNSPLTFAVPSANIRTNGKASVRDSFRAAVDEQLVGPRTRFNPEDGRSSLRTTLFHLAARRAGPLATGDSTRLRLHACPNPECSNGPIELMDVPEQQFCPYCNAEVYPSDCLRVWEEVTDFQSNATALSRLMLVIEHMLPMHYLRFLLENSPQVLGSTAFFVDGPLAIFGNGAWLHGGILRYFAEVNAQLEQRGLPRIIMIGLQKTGQVVDHIKLIDRYVQPGRIFAIDDDFRYQFILMGGREPAENGFGSGTYYGQDFIYKTPSGRIFCMALPYPVASKTEFGESFKTTKTQLSHYVELPRALALIDHFESDLYENAVIPIALAHRYTAISLQPGGKVLDLLTRRALAQIGT
ncbi:MAG: DNA double-strand break repair nuclease NurA [Chloroflexota bacterium]|nr:DNA double-strand break repair nuclease NurA [Chloroflexota bacterium]